MFKGLRTLRLDTMSIGGGGEKRDTWTRVRIGSGTLLLYHAHEGSVKKRGRTRLRDGVGEAIVSRRKRQLLHRR